MVHGAVFLRCASLPQEGIDDMTNRTVGFFPTVLERRVQRVLLKKASTINLRSGNGSASSGAVYGG